MLFKWNIIFFFFSKNKWEEHVDPVAHKTDAHNAVCTRMENLAFRQIPLKIHRGELTNALARARQKEEK